MGNFFYTKDGLRYNFADGYTDGTTNGYHYYIRDHQDNNRVVAKYDGTIMQTTHYYPYGGILSQSTNQGVQKFKYNGKEFDTMHGLNMYDYEAHQQDPAVGMFTSMDPLCEKYYNISPYSYCAGNPIRYVDPTGMAYGDYFDENGKHLGTGGIDDGEIYIVTDRKERKQISKNEGKVEPGSISSAQNIGNVEVLKASIDVLDRTTNNGAIAEECSVVPKNGKAVSGQQGTYSTATLPHVDDPLASIHSHSWNPNNGKIGGLATNPSGLDKQAFAKFDINVIVGAINKREPIYEPNTIHNGGTQEYTKPELGMCFYPKNAEEFTCRLSIYVVKKIIETLNKKVLL